MHHHLILLEAVRWASSSLAPLWCQVKRWHSFFSTRCGSPSCCFRVFGAFAFLERLFCDYLCGADMYRYISGPVDASGGRFTAATSQCSRFLPLPEVTCLFASVCLGAPSFSVRFKRVRHILITKLCLKADALYFGEVIAGDSGHGRKGPRFNW